MNISTIFKAFAILVLCSPAWCSFSYKRTITVDHTKVPNTDQTDFAVLLGSGSAFSGSLATIANGGKVTDSNGYDIGFYSNSDCSTAKLNWETEDYSATTGVARFWIKIASLSHSVDTVFYLCYGDSSITTDQSNKTGTWDSAFLGVWHFPNGSSLTTNDSTSNGFNLTNNNATPAITGQVDGAAGKFDGSTQYLSNASLSIPAGSSITVSYWENQATADLLASSLFNIGASIGLDRIQAHSPYNDQVLYWDYGTTIGGRVSTSYTAYLDLWAYISLVFDASNNLHAIYINGSSVASTTNSTTPTTTQTGLEIGRWVTAGSGYIKASIDEFRVSNSARGPDWIATEYNNQASPPTFYTVGAETAFSSGNAFFFGDLL